MRKLASSWSISVLYAFFQGIIFELLEVIVFKLVFTNPFDFFKYIFSWIVGKSDFHYASSLFSSFLSIIPNKKEIIFYAPIFMDMKID